MGESGCARAPGPLLAAARVEPTGGKILFDGHDVLSLGNRPCVACVATCRSSSGPLLSLNPRKVRRRDHRRGVSRPWLRTRARKGGGGRGVAARRAAPGALRSLSARIRMASASASASPEPWPLNPNSSSQTRRSPPSTSSIQAQILNLLVSAAEALWAHLHLHFCTISGRPSRQRPRRRHVSRLIVELAPTASALRYQHPYRGPKRRRCRD